MVIDLTGQHFGRLTVIKRAANDKYDNARWLCKCECGAEKIVTCQGLRGGFVLSCGCYHKDKIRELNTTHGGSNTRLFSIWRGMRARCNKSRCEAYSYYGGRGIRICDEWNNDFASFRDWSLANGYDDSLTIDRIDTNGNYEPSNCRWVTRKVQQNNTRRTRLFTIDGETKSIAEWCRIYGVPHERTRRRVMNEGWNIKDALTTPALKRNHTAR